MGRSDRPITTKMSPSSTNTTTSHIPELCTRVSAATKRGPMRPRYSPVATTARMPDTPSRSAGRKAVYPVRSEIVFSTSGSWMWRRTAPSSHPTASPTMIPPAPTSRNRRPAWTNENVPVTAAATATRYATIAAASFTMLSPSRIVTRRRGSGRRLRKVVAAATSGGDTTAPRANADAQGNPGTARRATQATTAVTNSTWPTPSNRIGRRLARTSRYDAKSDARYNRGGMNTRNTSCGSNCTAGSPGTRATSSPPTTSTAGAGMSSRRATSARKATPTKSARTVSNPCMAFGPSKVSFRRGALHLPVRPRRHAHRLDRADPPLLPPHHAHPPRPRAPGRGLDARPRHAPVGAISALDRGSRRDRGHGRDLPRLQPGAPRRHGPPLRRRRRGRPRLEAPQQDARPGHEQDAERRAARAPGRGPGRRLSRDRGLGRGHAPEAPSRAGTQGARTPAGVRPRRRVHRRLAPRHRVRARRGSEDRRRAVGAVRPLPPGRSRARLLAGAPGRHQLADGRQLTADSAFRRCALRFVPFELERWQSTWENRVRFNLSESGVHPLTVQELLGIAGASALPLLEVRLGYSQSNGTDLLRGRIAALYPGASPEQILVTTRSSEANFLVCWRLVEPGDKVAVMLPHYLQTWGLAQNFGAEVRGFQLHPDKAWEPFAEEIRTAIAPGTKVVVVTNPHNPTGHVLSDAARRTILERAAEVGAWLLADEVYQGAELDGKTTPSFWGGYERVIAVNGLSKAYGLPGLRIGWIVAPPALS